MHALTDAERARWHAFKGAADAVQRAVERDIAAATGLSRADFGVLDRLRLGAETQAELAATLTWSRSRLSHHLTRMAARGLLKRDPGPDGRVAVALTPAGRRAIDAALPIHAIAVRRHLLDRLTEAEARALDARAAAP